MEANHSGLSDFSPNSLLPGPAYTTNKGGGVYKGCNGTYKGATMVVAG